MSLITPSESYIEYHGGYKYQTNTDVGFLIPSLADYVGTKTSWLEIKKGGLLVITKGYAWDGASGPTIDTPSSMRGSLVHDALYQLMRMGMIPASFRPTADEIIKELCIKDDMWEWRASMWLKGLTYFGGKYVKASSRRKIKYAP